MKEYHIFLFHNLTNQKKITNKYVCFVTAFRSNFTSLVRVRNVWFVTCFRCWSRLDALVSFSRGFPRVALENSAGLLRCRVTSPGSWNLWYCLMLVLRWDGSVVTLLVLQCCGVYTVFDSRVCYLSQPVLGRGSSGPSIRRWRARKSSKRASRESRRGRARRFKLSGFGPRPQAAGPIRASVRDGAPPARLLLQGIFMRRKE